MSPVVVSAQVVINEVCPANADVIHDPQFFNFSPWVEIYNAGDASVNIGGFYLTDDPSLTSKWRFPSGTNIPAKSFLLVWCDGQDSGLHTNFSLDSDGETLLLSNSSMATVDELVFPKQYANISYGRLKDGESEIGYLVLATPRTANKEDTGAERLENPVLSLNSGRYAGNQVISMSHINVDAEIRFTADGSEPTKNSTLYTDPITVSKTTCVKAKAFLEGFLPSKTEVKSYFINEHQFSLPVISISTNSKYLWDATIGIYTDGTNGATGNCTDQPRNWNRDWDRHAVIEFFDASGEKEFDQSVDIRIGGACSRNNPQKSLVVKARDKYGKKTIDEKLFSTKESASYGGFILRNSGNDFWNTMFRDGLMQSLLIGQMDVDYLAYEPKIVYINGEYWGIMNLREKIDADYFETNYQVDKDDLDLIEWQALEGSMDAYNNYLATLQTMDPASPEAFAYIDQNIDVQEFINYLVAEIYYCNTDWPGNNVKFWRQRSVNGKWRWILWDLDFGFALYEGMSFSSHPTLEFATAIDGPGWPNPPWSTLHLRLLLRNPEFKRRFINTFVTALSTTFATDRVIDFIDSFQTRIKTEMPFHTTRWAQDMDTWNYEVQRLRFFAESRNGFMFQHLASFFGLEGMVRVSTNIEPAEAGKIILNGVTSEQTLNESRFFRGTKMSATAVPSTGYNFKSWRIKKSASTSLTFVTANDEWRYYDQGGLPAANWFEETFDVSSWEIGTGQFGYGEGDENTIIDFGIDSNNKFISTYFRKTFDIDDTTGVENIEGSILYDDGIVMYLNGVEVFRENMPGGTISDNTLALAPAPEGVMRPFTISKHLLKPGSNTIAVEIHQNGASSSDISFDMQMGTFKIGEEEELSSFNASIVDTVRSDIFLEALFEPVAPKPKVIINEFCASNSNVIDEAGDSEDWIEIYNPASEPVDLAGFYITDNLTNKTKFQIREADGTVVPPGAYKLVWADQEVWEGPLHVNFKLLETGEAIGIYQKIGNTLEVVDEISYSKMFSMNSYSRIPDVTGPFELTALLTPLAPNQLEIPVAIEEGITDQVSVYPNPFSSHILVKSEMNMHRLVVYSGTGQAVKTYDVTANEYELLSEDLPSGMYVLKIITDGQALVKKLIKL